TAVRVDLALRAVAEAEGITATEEDLEREIAQVAERVNEKPAKVRAEFERGGQLAAVRSDIRKQKALDWLLERVEIVDPQGQPIDRADLEITAGDPGSSAEDVSDGDDVNDETESDAE